MHKRISDIINTHGDKFRIEFIFASFGQPYDDINRYLQEFINKKVQQMHFTSTMNGIMEKEAMWKN